jgi:hypothetical protein
MTVLRAFLLLILLAGPATAEDVRTTLGFGRLFSNDQTGDGGDRWRTGSWTVSVVSGHGWTGERPDRFGDIVELRFRSEIIAPSTLFGPGSNDRPYVGALTYGLHSHWAVFGGEASAGIDVTLTGPQTGLSDLHDRIHERISAPNLSDEVVEGQIGDGVHPSVTVEWGRPLRVSDRATVRPFVEAQAGVEEIARIGADVMLGPVGQRDFMLRDSVTGHLYRVTRDGARGLSLVAGADWARVGGSLWLPEERGFEALDNRWRVRIGMIAQPFERADLFVGVTWLSPEFVGQPEGQALGSLVVSFRF